MKTVSALAGFFLTSTLAIAAHAGQDEVDLVDGTVLQGHIVRQEPGSFVVIQTDDGRLQSVPWSQIKRVSALASAPAPAPAVVIEPPAPSPVAPVELHFEMGARVGYSFPAGDYASGAPLGTASGEDFVGAIHGAVPLTLDLGMRIAKFVYVGGFFEYSFLSVSCFTPTSTFTSASCSGHDLRAGVDVQLHIRPRSAVDPWIGLGFGHEWLTADVSESSSSATASASQTFDGWNFADVMLGLDMRLPSGLAVGPYLEMSSGSFQSLSATATGGGSSTSASADITAQSSHQWITLGVRGTFEVQ